MTNIILRARHAVNGHAQQFGWALVGLLVTSVIGGVGWAINDTRQNANVHIDKSDQVHERFREIHSDHGVRLTAIDLKLAGKVALLEQRFEAMNREQTQQNTDVRRMLATLIEQNNGIRRRLMLPKRDVPYGVYLPEPAQ